MAFPLNSPYHVELWVESIPAQGDFKFRVVPDDREGLGRVEMAKVAVPLFPFLVEMVGTFYTNDWLASRLKFLWSPGAGPSRTVGKVFIPIRHHPAFELGISGWLLLKSLQEQFD
jgi:hypothetical protein